MALSSSKVRSLMEGFRGRHYVVRVEHVSVQSVLVTVRSPLSGAISSVKVRYGALLRWLHEQLPAELAFPDLSDEELELLCTGYTPECWDEMFNARGCVKRSTAYLRRYE